MNVDIEIFHHNKWHFAASFSLLGESVWGKVVDIVAKQFSNYQINAKELRKLFYEFSKKTERLSQIMQKANVDEDLIERLTKRISDVTNSLKEAKTK